MVFLSDPDEVKALFAAPPDALRPGEGARIGRDIVGPYSVMQLDQDEHLEQRRLILPTFQGERLERLAQAMTDIVAQEVAKWPRDQPNALHPPLQALTLEVVLRTVFGLESGLRLGKLRSGLIDALDANAKLLSLLPLTRRNLFGRGPWGRLMAAQQRNDALIYELIQERREENADGDDALSTLLAARHEDGTPMADKEIRDELMTLLIGGHESVAAALAWAFERLTRAPQTLDQLVDEIRRGKDDTYLTATLQELLRCHPVLPCIPRMVMSETRVGGWTYPPGVMVTPEPFLIHHDPSIYPDPFVFRPERFLEEPPGTYTWIPFGGGRRRCLGASFAMLEMRIVLQTVLGNLRVSPVSDSADPPSRRSILIIPRRGAQMVLSGQVTTSAA